MFFNGNQNQSSYYMSFAGGTGVVRGEGKRKKGMRDATVCYFLSYLEWKPERMETEHLQRHQGSAIGFLGTGHTIHFLFGSGVPWNESLTIVMRNRHSASRGKDTLQNLHLWFTGVSGAMNPVWYDKLSRSIGVYFYFAQLNFYVFMLPI